jgi:triphosphoribosyl-dephospho-CoA synthase
MTSTQLSESIRSACVLEATARKPGNVHPQAAFADVCHADFVRSADVVAPVLARAGETGVGQAVLDSVEATISVVGRNTNLGIVLLLAPLAAVPAEELLRHGIHGVLDRTTVADSRLVYRAIRRASPGGLGRAPREDVAGEPTRTLVEVMRLAADRDRIAQQYANGFQDVLQFGVETLLAATERCDDRETAVIALHLALMAELPDTLIARKCGSAVARESAERAQHVLDEGWPETTAGRNEIDRLDAWLRADGHRRNPGTTADLVAAALFAAVRDHAWPGTRDISRFPFRAQRSATEALEER